MVGFKNENKMECVFQIQSDGVGSEEDIIYIIKGAEVSLSQIVWANLGT